MVTEVLLSTEGKELVFARQISQHIIADDLTLVGRVLNSKTTGHTVDNDGGIQQGRDNAFQAYKQAACCDAYNVLNLQRDIRLMLCPNTPQLHLVYGLSCYAVRLWQNRSNFHVSAAVY